MKPASFYRSALLIPLGLAAATLVAAFAWLEPWAPRHFKTRVPGADLPPGAEGADNLNPVLNGRLIKGDGQAADLPGTWGRLPRERAGRAEPGNCPSGAFMAGPASPALGRCCRRRLCRSSRVEGAGLPDGLRPGKETGRVALPFAGRRSRTLAVCLSEPGKEKSWHVTHGAFQAER